MYAIDYAPGQDRSHVHADATACSQVALGRGWEDGAKLPVASRLGVTSIDVRAYPATQTVILPHAASSACAVVPVTGGVTVEHPGGSHCIGPGRALLVVANGRGTSIRLSGAVALVAHMPRAAIQAAGYARTRQARKLGPGAHVLDFDDSSRGIADAVTRLGEAVALGAPVTDDERRAIGEVLIDDLVKSLLQAPISVFPPAASVQRALDRLEHWTCGTSREEVARAAGVTRAVLARNIKETTGLTLSQFLMVVQLEWARGRLEGRYESRSIATLAQLAGFRTGQAFARAYQRRFGETPTQTRVRITRG